MEKENVDKIFLIRKGEKIKPLPSRDIREGLLGCSLEEGLQKVFEQYPEIIPGVQIYPVGENPPKFVLLCREMPIGNWSLDFLLVDQNAIPTLVEAKLVENPESRRSVIGQIIEYAANAAEAWGEGKLRKKTAGYWRKRGKDIEEIIKSFYEEDSGLDVDLFWSKIEENLAQRKIRLIIATDILRPEVRNMIVFLNTEFKNIEILGLEIKCYGKTDDSVVLVPRIVGQTQVTLKKTAAEIYGKSWSYNDLKTYYNNLENKILASRLIKILDWANKTGVLIESKVKNPSYGIIGILWK